MAFNLSSFFGAQDMTVGKPSTSLVRFAAPLLVGNFAQQLYNTVDSIVVGIYVGDNALASVGAANPLINLILVFFMGISTGVGIMVSQYFGAKERDKLSHTVGTTLTITFFVSLFIMIVGALISRPMLTLLQTPEEIYEMAAGYIITIFVGIMGMSYFNVISGILRGFGDSMMPLVFLLVTCGLNIVLDLFFVTVVQWGVFGVAFATVIAQFISAILCIRRLTRMSDTFTLNRQTLKVDGDLARQLVRLGLPAGLTQMVFSLAAIVVQSLTNSFGTYVIATNTVVMRVDGFAMMPNFTFGIAMTTYTGQNIGAGKIERVDEGLKSGMKIGVLVSCFLTGCLLLFGGNLMHLFTQTPEVVALGIKALQILAAGYIAMGVTQILAGVMRGAGDTMMPMWISIFTTVVIRVPLAYIMEYVTRTGEGLGTGNPQVLFYSMLICWLLGMVLHYVFYRRGGWRNKAITGQPTPIAEG